MEGYMFLWSIWFIWVFATFILDKNKPYRFMIASFSLAQIIVSPYKVMIGNMIFNGPFIIMGIFLFIVLANYSLDEKLFLLISVWTIGCFYAGFRFIEVYDPIWIIFDRSLLLALLLAIILYLLFYKRNNQWPIALIGGGMLGEVLAYNTLAPYGLSHAVGDKSFLDVIYITIIFSFSITYLSSLIQRLQLKIPMEKEKTNQL
ncbi:hypothetical protein WAK64_08915 [Bacillus spongiae]|uniref:Integral membrane protein n=1 Tax=Bacillus spongiae TaxID=2683610 RepID=A0ABU8HCV1_9BACI